MNPSTIRRACLTTILFALLLTTAPGHGADGADGELGPICARVRKAIADGRIGQTRIVGATKGASLFRETSQAGEVLIGLNVGLTKVGKLETVRSIQAIYQGPKGEVVGETFGKLDGKAKNERTLTVKAKTGYAVGGLLIRAGTKIEGLALEFLKIKDDRLDPGEAYTSEWAGDPTEKANAVALGGAGYPTVGICGNDNERQCMALGLVHIRAENAEKPVVPPTTKQPDKTPAPPTEPAVTPGPVTPGPAVGQENADTPNWVLPVLIGGGVTALVFVVMFVFQYMSKGVLSEIPVSGEGAKAAVAVVRLRPEQRVGFGTRLAAFALDILAVIIVGTVLGCIFGCLFGAGLAQKFAPDLLRMAQAEQSKMGRPAPPVTTKQQTEMFTSFAKGFGGIVGAFFGILAATTLVELIIMVFEGMAGSSFGKWKLGLCIRSADGQAALPGQLWTRSLIKWSSNWLSLVSLVLGLPFFPGPLNMLGSVCFVLAWFSMFIIILGCFMALAETRQALHDLPGKTAVFYQLSVQEALQTHLLEQSSDMGSEVSTAIKPRSDLAF